MIEGLFDHFCIFRGSKYYVKLEPDRGEPPELIVTAYEEGRILKTFYGPVASIWSFPHGIQHLEHPANVDKLVEQLLQEQLNDFDQSDRDWNE